MVKGLITSTEGMKAVLRRQEVLSNNLANVNTTGFKGGDLFTRAYLDQVRNAEREPFLNDEAAIDETTLDFTPGALIQTENPLDVAIQGKAFFSVLDKNGEVRYTRSGAFTRDAQGHLSTHNGEKVLGDSGNPIDIRGNRVSIGDYGDVVVDGGRVDRLKMAQFKEPFFLVRSGNNLFTTSEKTESVEVRDFKIHQGHLEGSNVNSVESMVKMIASFRNYEAGSKAIQGADQTLSKAVNEVGRVR